MKKNLILIAYCCITSGIAILLAPTKEVWGRYGHFAITQGLWDSLPWLFWLACALIIGGLIIALLGARKR